MTGSFRTYLNNYQNVSNQFRRVSIYCAEKKVLNVEVVTNNTVKSYLLYCLKSKGNNPVTITIKINNLRAFFNYMVKLQLLCYYLSF
ncbi:phage integrase SAM-like domain-containing protein [Pseudoneobacillus rhizosphaerae]|uniref:phage integrase SAM-like domain-containing protein n=1 Tax=Pseudoneobacillus rhizosphaerae TaxID=2880968 RepID=UPI00338FDBEC